MSTVLIGLSSGTASREKSAVGGLRATDVTQQDERFWATEYSSLLSIDRPEPQSVEVKYWLCQIVSPGVHHLGGIIQKIERAACP